MSTRFLTQTYFRLVFFDFMARIGKCSEKVHLVKGNFINRGPRESLQSRLQHDDPEWVPQKSTIRENRQ